MKAVPGNIFPLKPVILCGVDLSTRQQKDMPSCPNALQEALIGADSPFHNKVALPFDG